jgi:hypothetical protein
MMSKENEDAHKGVWDKDMEKACLKELRKTEARTAGNTAEIRNEYFRIQKQIVTAT